MLEVSLRTVSYDVRFVEFSYTLNYRSQMIYKVLCGTFATKIIYIQCCTEDGDSPAVTWA